MKRSITILMAIALCAAVAATASGAPTPKPSVVDAVGDANFLNDQGTGDGTFGDHVLPADASDFADIESVTFTNDKNNLYVHLKTVSSAPPAAGEGFRVRTNPDGPGGVYCLNFELMYNGAQNDMTGPKAHLNDACGGTSVEATASLSPLGGFLITVPRKGHEGLGKGAKLTAPQAQAFLWSGSYPTGVPGPYFDTTKAGTDYALIK